MLDGMTSEQFNEWRAKDIIEPIGSVGIHEILIRIGAMIAAMGGAEEPSEKMFAPWRKEVTPEASQETVFKTLEAVAGAIRT